jgi:hypothetical protein
MRRKVVLGTVDLVPISPRDRSSARPDAGFIDRRRRWLLPVLAAVVGGLGAFVAFVGSVPLPLSVLVVGAFTMLCLVMAYASAGPSALTANGMIESGLWLELDIGIGFVVAVGLGALMGQRTLPVILLVILEVIVTPIVTGHVIPYFINGQRLVVGVAMAQLRPAALGSGVGRGPLAGGAALQVPPMPTWAMITVIAGWILGWALIGAWKTNSRDA